ncbi:MAG: hypothetical protein ACK2T5_01445, partial [Anaerolineales bacterium]
MTTQTPQKEKKHANNILVLALAAGFVALIFFCVIVVFAFPLFERIAANVYWGVNWSLLEGYASLLQLALIIGGLVFAFFDRQQTLRKQEDEKRTLSFQQFENIHDRLVDPVQEEARRWIILNIPLKEEDQPLEDWFAKVEKIINRKPREWTEERTPGQIYVKQVLNSLDFLGFVNHHFWDASESDIEWFSPPVAKVWARL